MKKTLSGLSFSYLLTLSRPRFWLYVFGPFVIAWIAGFTQGGVGLEHVRSAIVVSYSNPWVILYTIVCVIYFGFIANLLIYGVNDYADRETDQHNQKKGEYEIAFDPEYKPALRRALLWWLIPSSLVLGLVTVMGGFMTLPIFLLSWGLFMFFALNYSLPPIRAKARPFVDNVFNVLYQFSALFGRVISGQSLTEYHILAWLGGWLGMMAWHTFSAIPDIEPDTKAGIATTATILGEQGTLLYCFGLWFVAFLLFFPLIGYWILPGLLVFCGFSLAAYLLKDTFRVYKIIPWIIPFLGTFYFWVLIFI